MSSNSGRRDFLKKLAFSGAAVGSVGTAVGGTEKGMDCCLPQVPRRPLGNTGRDVSILALGLGSVFTKGHENDPDATEAILQRALDHGINYWDTAHSYGPSEAMLGPMVEKNRDKIFLVSKSTDRSYDGFKREMENSLKLLKTDHIDLFHIHSLNPEKDTDFSAIEKGALKAAREAKDQGIIKHIGATGHSGANILKEALLAWDLEAMMTVLPVDRPDDGAYEDVFLPAAIEKNIGVMAMKTNRFARNSDLPGAQLVRYSLSLKGVSAAVVGLDSLAHLTENAAMCANFNPMSKDEMAAMTRIAKEGLANLGPAPWERNGYMDGMLA